MQHLYRRRRLCMRSFVNLTEGRACKRLYCSLYTAVPTKKMAASTQPQASFDYFLVLDFEATCEKDEKLYPQVSRFCAKSGNSADEFCYKRILCFDKYTLKPRTARMDNINTWTGLPVEESVKTTKDRDKWRK